MKDPDVTLDSTAGDRAWSADVFKSEWPACRRNVSGCKVARPRQSLSPARPSDQHRDHKRADSRDPCKRGVPEWVDVKKGPAQGDLVEIIGPLKDGDMVLRRGSDEIRQGAHINVRTVRATKGVKQ